MTYNSKSTISNIFISSLLPLLSRLALTVSSSPATAASAPEGIPSLTFLHDFIESLELQKPATMAITGARQMARLDPDSTLVLFSLQDREKIMIMAGAKPSSLIKKKILELGKKFSPPSTGKEVLLGCAPKTPLEIVDATQNQNRFSAEAAGTLAVAAATDHGLKSGRFILYTTSRPAPKERQLLNYCLQHLNKRTEEAQNWQELEKANRLDSLTGLNNRRHFDEIMEKESERARRYHHPTSLIMLDLDYFKKVNDNFGHQTGDLVLQKLGTILLEAVRKSDTPCRYGGEEFAVILPETGLCKAQRIAERIRKMIEQQNIVTHNNIHLKITASLGIASTENNPTIDLVRAADQALYRAKENGRNRIVTTPAPVVVPQAIVEPMISHCFPAQAVLNGCR